MDSPTPPRIGPFIIKCITNEGSSAYYATAEENRRDQCISLNLRDFWQLRCGHRAGHLPLRESTREFFCECDNLRDILILQPKLPLFKHSPTRFLNRDWSHNEGQQNLYFLLQHHIYQASASFKGIQRMLVGKFTNRLLAESVASG